MVLTPTHDGRLLRREDAAIDPELHETKHPAEVCTEFGCVRRGRSLSLYTSKSVCGFSALSLTAAVLVHRGQTRQVASVADACNAGLHQESRSQLKAEASKFRLLEATAAP